MLGEVPQLAVLTQFSGGEVQGHGSKRKLFSTRGQGTECGHGRWLELGLVEEELMDTALGCSLSLVKWQGLARRGHCSC